MKTSTCLIVGGLIGTLAFWGESINEGKQQKRVHLTVDQVQQIKKQQEENKRLAIESQKKNRKRGIIHIGDFAETVLYHWGNPSDFNQSIYSWGVHEQWIYRRGGSSVQYVYFENGIVTAIQTF